MAKTVCETFVESGQRTEPRAAEVVPGTTMLQAALDAGVDITATAGRPPEEPAMPASASCIVPIRPLS
jgi:hypothetical protein